MLVVAMGLRAADDQMTVTLDVSYTSKYIFRGVQLGENAFQPSLELSASDFYFGVWGNTPVGSDNQFEDNLEFDFYLGKNITLSDSTALDIGYTYYFYPELPSGSQRGTSEVYVGVNFSAGGLQPALYAFYDFDLEAWTFQGSVGTSIPLEKIGASLDLTATLGHVTADGGFSYTYWGLGAAIPMRLSERTTVTLGTFYSTHDITGLRDDHIGASLSLTVGW